MQAHADEDTHHDQSHIAAAREHIGVAEHTVHLAVAEACLAAVAQAQAAVAPATRKRATADVITGKIVHCNIAYLSMLANCISMCIVAQVVRQAIGVDKCRLALRYLMRRLDMFS